MSRLKDLLIDVESHLGSLLNEDGLTNDQALNVIEQTPSNREVRSATTN